MSLNNVFFGFEKKAKKLPPREYFVQKVDEYAASDPKKPRMEGLKSGVKGAVGGSLAGALTGAAFKGKKGAAAGALIGSILPGAVGYEYGRLKAKHENKRIRQAKFLKSFPKDVQESASRMTYGKMSKGAALKKK